MAYSYDKLGMTDTANQYKQLLKINYPDLLSNDGNVLLENTRSAGDWLNKLSFGVLGKSEKTQVNDSNATGNTATKPQVIQSVQQAMQLQLATTQAENEQLPEMAQPRKVNLGLGLPEEQ